MEGLSKNSLNEGKDMCILGVKETFTTTVNLQKDIFV